MNLAWFGNAVFEIDPLPQGALVGLAPTKQISKPQNWTMKHYKSVDFLSNSRMSRPLHKRKASLFKTFRFCW